MAKRTVVELEELRDRLREAEETLAAIRNGEVDSLIVSGPQGDQVFSLKGAEQPYRVFVEQMSEGAVTLTPDGTILYCNRRFAEMMNSRLERVIGARIQSFVRPADHTKFAEILGESEGKKVHLILAAANDAFVPAQLSFSRMPVDEIDAISLVITDMTEQEEKRELAAALENLRSAQVQLQRKNDELAKARVAAEAASEAKDNFLAALSHELRTPLTPVLMTITSLETDASLDAQLRSRLSMVRRNVELEARLIDDLLDVTRIVRGKVELKSEVVDAHSILARALEICYSDLTVQRLDLVQDLLAETSHVEVDAVRLQQILWNLLRNAIKFTPEGGQIIVRTNNANGNFQLTVSDTGIGIEADVIDKLFTPFEQTNRSITQKFGGLGLGLAISKRLAELQGGTLTAYSEGRGRGATFTLTLPQVESPVPSAASMALPPTGKSSQRLNILLVEDHDDTRESLALILGRKHKVLDVCSIATALEAAVSNRFDLVISDLGLPDGSGLELMRQLRDQYSMKGICLSGFGMEEDVARSAAVGFDHHLTKPVDFNKLEEVIESLAAKPTSATQMAK